MSLSYPDDRRYHPEHLWAQSRSDGSVLVGISDYAQDQLGAVIFVELPETGAHFTQGQSCASIESAKVTSDAVMPLSGTVLEINEALADTPELLNQSPYGEGWLVRVKADDPAEPGLISAAATPPKWSDPFLMLHCGVPSGPGNSLQPAGDAFLCANNISDSTILQPSETFFY